MTLTSSRICLPDPVLYAPRPLDSAFDRTMEKSSASAASRINRVIFNWQRGLVEAD